MRRLERMAVRLKPVEMRPLCVTLRDSFSRNVCRFANGTDGRGPSDGPLGCDDHLGLSAAIVLLWFSEGGMRAMSGACPSLPVEATGS